MHAFFAILAVTWQLACICFLNSSYSSPALCRVTKGLPACSPVAGKPRGSVAMLPRLGQCQPQGPLEAAEIWPANQLPERDVLRMDSESATAFSCCMQIVMQ
jgi:hypothetical protein